MNFQVVLRMVPDVVEELVVGPDGKSLDPQALRMILSETDNHALEQALLLKERHGGTVTAVALEAPDVDEVLFTSLAKGAGRAVKVTGDFAGARCPAVADLLAGILAPEGKPPEPDTLVLVGSQAIDDLEGELGPCLADRLGIPFVGVVCAVTLEPARKAAVVLKEFAGGLRGEFEVSLPAVLGIQSAEKPPRYVPVAKVRAVMKSARIEEVPSPVAAAPPGVLVDRLYKPEGGRGAEMIEGTPEEIAARLADLLRERRLIG